MGRLARVVVPGCPHHITQRGNHRQDVFFCDEDRRTYLKILRDHSGRCGLQVLAWCLMSNHVHLVAIPSREDCLARALGRTHGEFARWLHVRYRQIGHLWQNRFYSCPLEETHLWEAIRYVELNPLRAGLVGSAAEWLWSSAGAHLGNREPWDLTHLEWWRQHWLGGSWDTVLTASVWDAAAEERLRETTRTGRPCGSSAFIRALESATGRPLGAQKRGPKPKLTALPAQKSLVIA